MQPMQKLFNENLRQYEMSTNYPAPPYETWNCRFSWLCNNCSNLRKFSNYFAHHFCGLLQILPPHKGWPIKVINFRSTDAVGDGGRLMHHCGRVVRWLIVVYCPCGSCGKAGCCRVEWMYSSKTARHPVYRIHRYIETLFTSGPTFLFAFWRSP